MSDSQQAGWPKGVKQLVVGDLKRLGIDDDHQIYWDGRRIEIRKSIVLTGFQKIVATVVTVIGLLAGLSTIATGVNNATIFLCARGHQWMSCPLP
jgi:hypothetical protein